ncbi:MAG TPA: hypothetical protein VM512_16885 [Burkholderiaceae bacterium]|nr:hypothetical protein [Burkholderiaceae bacterium]
MSTKYLPLIADYESRIELALSEGNQIEVFHLLDRLRELPNMPDFSPIAAVRLQAVMDRYCRPEIM